jgi:hypothetical protein
MKHVMIAALCVALGGNAAFAQQAGAPLPITAQVPGQTAQTVLPANTELVVRMNDELSSKTANEGDSFGMSVAQNVMLNGYVIIPQGSRAVGEVTWKTGKGAFGKSGKMEIQMRYVEVNGQRIRLEGKFRQEGEGNTVATVAGVVAVGVFAAFITGKTAVIPRGRELTVHTVDPVPVVLPGQPISASVAAGPAIVPVSVAAPSARLRMEGESCSSYADRISHGKSGVASLIEEKCRSHG